MDRSKRSESGFVLLLTMLIISLMVLLVTYLSNKTTVHTYFDNAKIQQEQARQAALNGIAIACSLLTPAVKEKKEGNSNKNMEYGDIQEHLVLNVLPYLNRWRSFSLKKEVDGIDATTWVCISSEEGKIALNSLFDFQKHTFMPAQNQIEPKKIIAAVANILKGDKAPTALDESFEIFFKQRTFPFNDATELTLLKALPFAYKTHLFYNPLTENTKDKRPSVYLMDVFTTWHETLKINPWFLSDSLCALFGLKRVTLQADTQERVQAAKLLNDMKKEVSLKERWNSVGQKLYGREYNALPKDLVPLLDENIRAKNFSVVSYGSVGTITKRLLAIITQEAADKFVIKKLYWT